MQIVLCNGHKFVVVVVIIVAMLLLLLLFIFKLPSYCSFGEA